MKKNAIFLCFSLTNLYLCAKILHMKTSVFFGKIFSGYLWRNLIAMAIVVVLLCVGVKYGLDFYTHHGEGIPVPNVTKMPFYSAKDLIESDGLFIVISDSGYNKRLPADCVLAQSPGAGMRVKRGHTIYITINAPSSPSFPLPDLIENCNYREAAAKLTAMGFRLLPPKRISGEKDWVYGIVSHGKSLSAGDLASIAYPLTLVLGNGKYDSSNDDIDYVDPDFMLDGDMGDTDDFEEVPEPSDGTIDDSGMSDF